MFFQYMVYMLKFDIAHSSTTYHKKEFSVRESPTGQVSSMPWVYRSSLLRKNITMNNKQDQTPDAG